MIHTARQSPTGRIKEYTEEDYRVWLGSRGDRRYAKRYLRCRSRVRDLPAKVVARAAEIAAECPYKSGRKYFKDVTEAEWSAIREYVMDRDGGLCVYCGDAAEVVDHIIPASRMGSWHPDNCAASCSYCNGRKADRTPEEWRLAR